MRHPWVQSTVRLGLFAIFVVGVALGTWVITMRRAAPFGERVRHHAEEIFGIEDEISPDPSWEEGRSA